MTKVHSLELAKAAKKEMEKEAEARRAKRESDRATIAKNKKDREEKQKKEEEKKVAEEKKLLKEMKKVSMDLKNVSKEIKKLGKLAVKQSVKLGTIEAAPKEEIVPTVEAPAVPVASYRSRPEVEVKIEAAIETVPSIEAAIEVVLTAVPVTAEAVQPEVEEKNQLRTEDAPTGTDGAYQSRLRAPLINWRAEIEKREEARRARNEWIRAEIEKKRNEAEEERKKQEEKKMQEERELAKEIEEDLKSLSDDIREAKKLALRKPSKPCQSVVKKMALESDPGSESIEKATETVPSIAAPAVPVSAGSALTGTDARYKSWAEIMPQVMDVLRREEARWKEIEKKKLDVPVTAGSALTGTDAPYQSQAEIIAQVIDVLRRQGEARKELAEIKKKIKDMDEEWEKERSEKTKEREAEWKKEREEEEKKWEKIISTLTSLSEELMDINRKLKGPSQREEIVASVVKRQLK